MSCTWLHSPSPSMYLTPCAIATPPPLLSPVFRTPPGSFLSLNFLSSIHSGECHPYFPGSSSSKTFFFFFFVFVGPHLPHMEVPRPGSNQSCSHWPTPEPQQCRIWAVSASYNTAQGNAGSLTHWAKPGIEPEIPWFPVGFISAAPQWELTNLLNKKLQSLLLSCLDPILSALLIPYLYILLVLSYMLVLL